MKYIVTPVYNGDPGNELSKEYDSFEEAAQDVAFLLSRAAPLALDGVAVAIVREKN